MTDRSIFVVYCDDIRREVGNKQSWMGIYSGELIVPALPTLLPKLCMAVTITTPKENPIQRLRLYAKLNDEMAFEVALDEQALGAMRALEEQAAANGQEPTGEFPARRAITSAMALGPFPIERESTLRVFAETEVAGEILVGRRLRMRSATPEESARLQLDAPEPPAR